MIEFSCWANRLTCDGHPLKTGDPVENLVRMGMQVACNRRGKIQDLTTVDGQGALRIG